jgi:hypothetical protein
MHKLPTEASTAAAAGAGAISSENPEFETFVWKGQVRYRCPHKRADGSPCPYDTYDLSLMRAHARFPSGMHVLPHAASTQKAPTSSSAKTPKKKPARLDPYDIETLGIAATLRRDDKSYREVFSALDARKRKLPSDMTWSQYQTFVRAAMNSTAVKKWFSSHIRVNKLP